MKHTHDLAIPTTLQDACHPQRMALLVYDMQVGICSQVKTAGQVVTRISGLLAVARSKGMRVAFTRHLSLPKTWMGAMQYRTAMAWQAKDEPDSVAAWFLRDAPGFQIVSELAPRPEEVVFDKITMLAFEGTPLAIALRDCGISSIAIVGIATEVGIEPTARHCEPMHGALCGCRRNIKSLPRSFG
jgi:biuret amidohydrolase